MKKIAISGLKQEMVQLSVSHEEISDRIARLILSSWNINPQNMTLAWDQEGEYWFWEEERPAGPHSGFFEFRRATREEVDIMAALKLVSDEIRKICEV